MTVDYSLVRPHRAPSRARRIGHGLGAVVLILATIVIGRAIAAGTPGVDEQQRPFIRTGITGSMVDAGTFDATVLGVRGATLLSDGVRTHDTSGIWVIVKVRLTALGDPLTIPYTVLLDGDGRTYRATSRIDQSLVGGRELQPGLPVTGEIAFEVPVSVVDDLAIRLASNDLDQRMDVLVQIRIPISDRQIGQWRAAKDPAVLTKPAVSA